MSRPPLAADPLRSGRGIFELQSYSTIRSPMPKATMGACLQPISSPRESPRAAPNLEDGHQIQEEFQRLCQSSPVPKVVMDRLQQPKKAMPPPPPPPPGQYQVDVRMSVPTEEESRPRVSGFNMTLPTPATPGAASSSAAAANPLAPSPRQRQAGGEGAAGEGLSDGAAAAQPAGASPPAAAPPKLSSKGSGGEAKGPNGEPKPKPKPATVTLKAWHLKRLGKKTSTLKVEWPPLAAPARPLCLLRAPWQRPSSTPVPPQAAAGGSRQLGTPRVRPSHWASGRSLGGSSELPPKSPIPPPLTAQAVLRGCIPVDGGRGEVS